MPSFSLQDLSYWAQRNWQANCIGRLGFESTSEARLSRRFLWCVLMDIYLITCFLRGTDPSLWGGGSPSVTQKKQKKNKFEASQFFCRWCAVGSQPSMADFDLDLYGGPSLGRLGERALGLSVMGHRLIVIIGTHHRKDWFDMVRPQTCGESTWQHTCSGLFGCVLPKNVCWFQHGFGSKKLNYSTSSGPRRGILFDIIFGILADILSGILCGILSDIYSDILSDILLWNSFWHSLWHSIWHLFWHSVWHSFWHSSPGVPHSIRSWQYGVRRALHSAERRPERWQQVKEGRKEWRKEGVAHLLKSRGRHLAGREILGKHKCSTRLTPTFWTTWLPFRRA